MKKRPSRRRSSEAFQESFDRQLRQKPDPLMQAGLELFASRGYDDTRVADIAEACDIAVGSLYNRFPSKQAFFSALEQDLFRRATQNLDRFLAAADPRWSARRLLEELVRYMLASSQRTAGYIRTVVSLRQRGEHPSGAGELYYRYRARRVHELLQARGVLGPGSAAARRVLLALNAVNTVGAATALLADDRADAKRDALVSELSEMLYTYFTG
ncbi:MAG TPA: helix-turn-helix domain-containing protein [Pseudomonadales bacterium]